MVYAIENWRWSYTGLDSSSGNEGYLPCSRYWVRFPARLKFSIKYILYTAYHSLASPLNNKFLSPSYRQCTGIALSGLDRVAFRREPNGDTHLIRWHAQFLGVRTGGVSDRTLWVRVRWVPNPKVRSVRSVRLTAKVGELKSGYASAQPLQHAKNLHLTPFNCEKKCAKRAKVLFVRAQKVC